MTTEEQSEAEFKSQISQTVDDVIETEDINFAVKTLLPDEQELLKAVRGCYHSHAFIQLQSVYSKVRE